MVEDVSSLLSPHNREVFLAHYHKRSNAESTLAAIDAKFGDRIRSKTDAARVNEVLAKVLAHDICTVVRSMHELGAEPTFRARCDSAQRVP